MLMEAVLNATEVRANFGEFIDTVVRVKPQVVKRNRDFIFTTSLPMMRFLLSSYELNYEYEVDEDGRYAGSIEEIEFIVADGANLEELRANLVHHLMDYAHDYMNEFPRYFNAPNTKKHAPYVLRVLLEDDAESVASMLHGDAELE